MATELGAGYIELSVKYDDALKKIGSDLTGLERTSADVSKRVSSNLSGGFKQAHETGLKGLIREFKTGFDEGSRGANNMTRHLEGVNAQIAGVTNRVIGLTGRFADVDRQAVNFAQRGVVGLAGMNTKALAVGAGVLTIGAAVVVVGKQLYDLGAQWDDISDSITIRTGKVGDELKKLTGIVGEVGRATAADLGSIGDIVGQLSQSLPGLSRNADAFKVMASNLAYLNANGQAVDIRTLARAFNVFGVSAEDTVPALDALNAASQKSGIPINELLQTITKGAPQFKQFGLDIGESTALLTLFEQAGLNVNVAVVGLRTALAKIGGDNPEKKLAEIVTQIKALYDAGNSPGAKAMAEDLFGIRNFPAFLDLIEGGTLDMASLNKVMGETSMSLQEQQQATDDGAQGWTKLSNTIKDKFGPWANQVFGLVNKGILYMTDGLGSVNAQLDEISTKTIDPNSTLGKILSGGVSIPGLTPGAPGMPGGPPLPLPTTKPTTPTAGLGPNFYKDWYEQTWGKGAGAAKAAEKPVLPIDTTLPPGFGEIPDLFSEESAYIDARHDLEEKRALLNQLESANVKDANAIQQAKNDVFTSDRSFQESERKLYDARQGMYDKEAKRIEDERKKAEDEYDKFQTSFTGGSLLDLLLYLVFQPKFDELKRNMMPQTTSGGAGTGSNLLGGATHAGGGAGGTLALPGPAAQGGAAPTGLNWDALAAQESSGNWQINSGNGYYGGLQFDQATWAQYGGTKYAPNASLATKEQQIEIAQIAYNARGGGSSLWPANYMWLGGFQSGGSVPGKGSGDIVPILGEPGEHMFTTADVNAMGGQQSVYAFRRALHMQDGGDVYGLPGDTNTGGYGSGTAATFPPWVMALAAQYGVTPSTYGGHQATERSDIGAAPNPQHLNRGIDWVGPPDKMRAFAQAMAGGGAEQVIFSDKQGNIGYPFNVDYSGDYAGHTNHVHTRFSRAPGPSGPIGLPGFPTGTAPGLNPLQAMQGFGGATSPATGASESKGRTEGYIPAGAGTSGQAGSSFVSGLFGMGADVVNYLIDQGVSVASMAAQAGLMAGTMGASAAAPGAGQAATAGLQIAADVAKKGVKYVAQLGGIWSDAAAEILMPFGVPRFFQTDPNAFMPRIGGLPTAQTTGEKAQLGSQNAALSPSGPVQPGQLAGQQPVGPPVKPAEGGGISSSPLGGIISSALGGGPGPGAPAAPVPAQPPKTLLPGKPTAADDLLKNLGIFDEGGWLGGVGVNTTGKPEPVLSHEQNVNLQAIANKPVGELDPAAGGGVNYDYRVVLQNVTVKDVDELQRQLSDRQRLQMMRHAGRPSMGGA